MRRIEWQVMARNGLSCFPDTIPERKIKRFLKVFIIKRYNNQWIVVDYKKYVSGEEIQDDTLWILEQIPGYTERCY